MTRRSWVVLPLCLLGEDPPEEVHQQAGACLSISLETHSFIILPKAICFWTLKSSVEPKHHHSTLLTGTGTRSQAFSITAIRCRAPPRQAVLDLRRLLPC